MSKKQIFYNKEGDILEVFWSDENYYGKYINEYLTIFKSEKDDRIIGYDISWVSELYDKVKKNVNNDKYEYRYLSDSLVVKFLDIPDVDEKVDENLDILKNRNRDKIIGFVIYNAKKFFEKYIK